MASGTPYLYCVMLAMLAACGGSDDSADDQPDGGSAASAIAPLPVGAGLYFTTQGLFESENAQFFSADATTGNTTLTGPTDESRSNTICSTLVALDLRPDGTVLGIGKYKAEAYLVDPRTPPTTCREFHALPEIMHALAVRADGHVFMTSDAKVLYELDENLSVVAMKTITTPVEGLDVTVAGMDFEASGTLRVVTGSQMWMTLDTSTGMLNGLDTIDLRDDFDIDAGNVVRGLSGDEYRTYNLQGNTTSGISLFGGTTYATGVVYR